MLSQILRNTEWHELSDFVSPALLKVMPASAAWQVARTLRKNKQDRPLRQDATEQRRQCLLEARLPIALVPPPPHSARTRSLLPAQSAQHLVELYFHQLFAGSITLLDLRPRAFSRPPGAADAAANTESGDTLDWHPAPWLWRWDAAFLGALRKIYRGFYTDDQAQFREGLQQLSLEHAEPIFREHFGGDQAHVQFRTKDFVSTFHHVFQVCRDHGVCLAPNFLPLGLYLATLYEHLEALGVPVDVRAAFARVVPREQGRTLH
jgi:hypothetical protein